MTESKDENITFQEYNSSKFTTNQSVNRQNVFVTGANKPQMSDEKLKVSSDDHSYHEANYPEVSGNSHLKDLDSLTEEQFLSLKQDELLQILQRES